MRTPARWVAAVRITVVGVAVSGALLFAPGAHAQFVFEGAARERVGRSPSCLAVADFDGDGLPDAACGDADDTVSVLRNDGGSGFVLAFAVAFAAPSGLVAGDWNEDGFADLAAASERDRAVGIFLGDGAGSLASPAIVSLDFEPWDLIGADLDGDGHGDLAVPGGEGVILLFGDGSGGFLPPVALPMPRLGDVLALRAADLNGDGALELVAAALPESMAGAAHAAIFGRAAGSRDFAARSEFSVPLRWPSEIVAEDLDGDGRRDLLFTSLIGDSPQLFRGGGADGGAFADPVAVLGADVLYAAAHDFDRDGVVDVAATGGYRTDLRLFRGDGRGTFEAEVTLRTGAAPRRLVIADFDRDERADVATANWRDASDGTVTPFLNRTLPACFGGSVNRGAGAIADVLFVNDTAGSPDRTVRLASWEPLFVLVSPPPLATRPAAFALFAWAGKPTPEDERPMPHGIGVACRPILAWQGEPRPVAVWNNTGLPALGRSPRPSSPAPCLLVERRSGAGRAVTFFLQGVIEDPGSASDRLASVTNGVLVEIR